MLKACDENNKSPTQCFLDNYAGNKGNIEEIKDLFTNEIKNTIEWQESILLSNYIK